jgi:nicotinate-nucleotide adenylyltransferase
VGSIPARRASAQIYRKPFSMKIALFGGRFDPPHIGHFLIAQQILKLRSDIEKVLFIPANNHSWNPIIASSKTRLAMLKLGVSEKMAVSDVEIKRGGISYCIDTLKEIKEQTNAELFWIIGSDNIKDFKKWKNYKEILKLAKILVFPRNGYKTSNKLPKGFETIESRTLITTNISSMHIRQRIKEKESIEYLVPKNIKTYIIEKKLYV